MKLILSVMCLFAAIQATSDLRRLQAETEETCNPLISATTVNQQNATTHCAFFPYEVCSQAGKCVHKGVFPVLTSELLGLLILPLLLGTSSVAGLAGGVVFVPIMMAFFHFKTK